MPSKSSKTKKIQVDLESSFQRRLGTSENVFDWEMKSEGIQNVTCYFISDKISF